MNKSRQSSPITAFRFCGDSTAFTDILRCETGTTSWDVLRAGTEVDFIAVDRLAYRDGRGGYSRVENLALAQRSPVR
jgi:hypothetical protein